MHRLYQGSTGWLCIAVAGDAHWRALTSVIPGLGDDARFADAASRKANDAALVGVLTAAFAERSAEEWVKVLDDAGVPAEVSDPNWSKGLFDDPDYIERGWVVHLSGHETVGEVDMYGIGVEYSATPSKPGGPSPSAGQHSREILASLGCDDAAIAALVEAGAVVCNDR